MKIEGAATFIRLPLLAAELERVPESAELHVEFENLDYIDHACLELLVNWAPQHAKFGGELVIDWEQLHARFGTEDQKAEVLPIKGRDGSDRAKVKADERSA